MKATAKDLRFNTREILDAACRGEEVVITFRGKPKVRILPFKAEITMKPVKQNFSVSGKIMTR